MRTRLMGSKVSLLFVIVAALLLAVAGTTMALTADPNGNTAPAPTIQSDKADYFPGETVTLTGSNWQPGESVHIYVNDEEGNTWSRNYDVTADENGAIRDEFQLPDWFVATYKVTATGEQSGVATTSFTDGNVRFTATSPAPSSWTVNYKLFGGPGNSNNTCNDTVSTPPTSSVTISGTGTPPVQVNVSGNQSLKLVSVTENDPSLGFKRWTLADLTTPVANDACLSGQGATHNLVAHFSRAPLANPQPLVTTDEDTSKLITLSATDPENDPLTYKIISLPTNGKLYKGNSTTAADEIKSADLPFTLPGSGNQVTYKPNADFNGNDLFAFRANDGTSDSINTAPVPIRVNPVNDTPVGTDETKTMSEDGSPLSIDFGALVSDVETSDANLTYNITAPPSAQGSLSGGPGPTRTFTPAANFNGTVNINYTVTDRGDPDNCGPASPPSCTAAKTSVQKTVTVTVNAVNDNPVATDDTATTDEDNAVTIDVKANDTDVDGDNLTITNVTNPAHGTAVVDNGKVKYTPAPNYHGPDSFSYTISDGNGGTDTADVSVTVTPVNDDPVAEDDNETTAEDTPLNSINVLGNDTDVDGDTLSVSSVGSPNHGTATKNDDETIKYTPNANYHGPDSFTYTVSDGNGGTDTAAVNLTVTAVNDAPVAEADSYDVNEDNTLNINAPGVLSNDSDVDNDKADLEAILVDGTTNGDLTLNADGSFSYTPNLNFFGDDSFTYKANDGTDDSNTVTVSIKVNAVNDAPVAKEDSYDVNEDNTLNINAPGVLSNDEDVDGDSLTAAQVAGPAHGTLTLNENGSFEYKPDANFFGDDSFTYKASDGQADSNTVTVKITVNPVNDAPVAKDDSYQVDEDQTLNITAPGVLENDTDVDNTAAELKALQVSGPAHGTLTLNENGSFEYKPDANFFGDDSFTYKANDGQADSEVVTVSITVNAVNDAPVAQGDSYDVNEDNPLNVNAPGVLENDSDVDNPAADLEAILVDGTTNGDLTLEADGSFSYTPNLNFFGEDSFTYKANDGADDSNTVTVTITVNPVNDAPVPVDNSYTTPEDTPLTVEAPGLLGNDTDVEKDTLKVADGNADTADGISPVRGPTNGTVELHEDGSFIYTPNANYHGPDSFDYRVCDNGSPEPTCSMQTATVNVTINAVNDTPVAVADSYPTNEDAPLTISAQNGVLSNDTDVDGDPLEAVLVSGPSNGTLMLNADGSFTYTPNPNFNGEDTFTYRAVDPSDAEASATVTVTIVAVNDDPVANDQSVTTEEDTPRAITLGASDVDGDPLSYSVVSGPQHGTLSGSGANLTYTPANNYNGPDSFTFKANDGTADSNEATVSITVTPVNDKPVVTNLQGADTANEGETKAYTFQITDDDSSNFTFASGSLNCGAPKGEVVSGTAQINGNNGSFECKFLDGGVPPTQVTVSAKVTDDSQASSDAATKNVGVSNVAPRIESLTGPAQVLTNQPVTFTGTHSDPAGLLDNPFTWQWSGGTSTDTDKNNSYVTKFTACGPQNVKATVTDKDTGTSAEATLSSPVQAYNGNFLPPLQMSKDNLVQKGQVVPVKISVAGCDGLNLAGLSPYIQLFSGDPTAGINEADFIVPTASVSSADTGQNMRPVSDGYIYNLRVPSDAKATVGAKYYIRVSPFGVASGQHMIISIQIRK